MNPIIFTVLIIVMESGKLTDFDLVINSPNPCPIDIVISVAIKGANFNRIIVTVEIPSIGETHTETILLSDGKTGSKTFTFSSIPNDVVKQDMDIILTASYGYSVEDSSRIIHVAEAI